MSKPAFKAPRHLRAPTRRWVEDVVANFELEPHHLRLLQLAAESWDRCQGAREALAMHGTVFTDRLGAIRPRPEVQIERTSMVTFARLLRELRLDVAPPDDPRMPGLGGGRHYAS